MKMDFDGRAKSAPAAPLKKCAVCGGPVRVIFGGPGGAYNYCGRCDADNPPLVFEEPGELAEYLVVGVLAVKRWLPARRRRRALELAPGAGRWQRERHPVDAVVWGHSRDHALVTVLENLGLELSRDGATFEGRCCPLTEALRMARLGAPRLFGGGVMEVQNDDTLDFER